MVKHSPGKTGPDRDYGLIGLKLLKSAILRGSAWAIARTGVLGRQLEEGRLQPPWRVLRYERVLDPTQHPYPILTTRFVTPDAFRAQIRLLSSKYKLVPLGILFDAVRTGRPVEPGTIALTFDGGWAEYARTVFPFLKELKLPATFFLPTSFVGSMEMFWKDKITVTLHMMRLGNRAFPRLSVFAEDLWDNLNRLEKTGEEITVEKIFVVTELLGRMPLAKRAIAISEIAHAAYGLGSVPIERTFLSWDEVREAAGGDIFFASATHNNFSLTDMTREELAGELRESFMVMRQERIQPVPAVAIPDGIYRKEHLSWFLQAGLKNIVSFGLGGTIMRENDCVSLDRAPVFSEDADSLSLFECRVWNRRWGLITL